VRLDREVAIEQLAVSSRQRRERQRRNPVSAVIVEVGRLPSLEFSVERQSLEPRLVRVPRSLNRHPGVGEE
jgi:hypothetical protein